TPTSDLYPLSLHDALPISDLPRLAEGGVGAQFWSVYVPVSLAGEAAVAVTLEQIDFVHRMAGRYPNRLELALTDADVERIFAAEIGKHTSELQSLRHLVCR